MTFTELKTRVKDQCGLSSTEADTRIGKSLNAHYRRITAQLGMDSTRFVTRAAVTTDDVRTLTFSSIEKIDRIIDVTGTVRLLQEVSMHELRSIDPVEGQPSQWAVQSRTADTITVVFDTIPDDEYTLHADGTTSLSDMSGTDEPAFSESFHDILAWFVISEELLKKEKAKLALEYERKAKELLAELVFQHADSPTTVTRARDASVPTLAGGGAVAGAVDVSGFTDLINGTSWVVSNALWVPTNGPGNTIIIVDADGENVSTNLPAVEMPVNTWHRIDLRERGIPSTAKAIFIVAVVVSSGDAEGDPFAITVSAKPPSSSTLVSQYFGASTAPTGLGFRDSLPAVVALEDGQFDFAWNHTATGATTRLVNVFLHAIF